MSVKRSPFGHVLTSETRREREEQTAFHEAGHAVVACEVGCEDVWIDVAERRTHYETPKRLHGTQAGRRADLSVYYAGAIAVFNRYGDLTRSRFATDERAATKVLETFPERERGKVTEQAAARAESILAERWDDVEWIARMAQTVPVIPLKAVEHEGETIIVASVARWPAPLLAAA
jgi:hypothetical protein